MTDDLAGVGFWTSAALVLYAYAGYPLLLLGVARRRPAGPGEAPALPSVTVIVAACNEEACIVEKVRNVLAHDYPAERLDCVVVSDGSTDGTDAHVAPLAGPRVRLLRQERGGKNAALNHGARHARGEVLVFTDADALMTPGALRRLVAPFADARVGLVSGRGLYRAEGGVPVANVYVRYETLLKRLESRLGFIAYADGALYAMRAALYRPLPLDQVHDLLHPIEICLAGRRSVFEPAATTVEPACSGPRVEYRRQVRMIAQGMRVLGHQIARLARHGQAWPVLVLLSHRVLRWAAAPLLVLVAASSVWRAQGSGFFLACVAAQAAFYALAAVGAAAGRHGGRLAVARVPFMFCLASAAAVTSLFHLARGRTYAAWARPGPGAAA